VSPSTARRSGRSDLRYSMGFILGVCVGMSLSLVLVTVAYLVARPATPVTAPATTSTSTSTPAAAAPAAAIDVTARHLGDLKVLIEAQITAPTTYDPITKARVVAYTDMVVMPQAHRQGPIQLAELSDRKGVYQGMTTVAMIGEYDVHVEVLQPMPAVAHERVAVGAVAPAG